MYAFFKAKTQSVWPHFRINGNACLFVTYVIWENYIILMKWSKKKRSSVFLQCLVFLLCITQVFGERSPGPIPKTWK